MFIEVFFPFFQQLNQPLISHISTEEEWDGKLDIGVCCRIVVGKEATDFMPDNWKVNKTPRNFLHSYITQQSDLKTVRKTTQELQHWEHRKKIRKKRNVIDFQNKCEDENFAHSAVPFVLSSPKTLASSMAWHGMA